MQTIQLQQATWKYDPKKPLGAKGGFGEVFEGIGNEGVLVAIKRLLPGEDQSGAREIRIAAELTGNGSENLVQAIDFGYDPNTNNYFVVMPKCECSLEDWLNSNGGSEDLAIEIADEILAGLEAATQLVHRDLKPSNILRLNQKWAIADFGIAKFVEESTSLNTLNDALSPPYAAPEQWQFQPTSAATDIYALGCILFRVVCGVTPFGNSPEGCKQGHLNLMPPDLNLNNGALESLILMMMRKSPETRPTRASCQKMLERVRLKQTPKIRGFLQKASLEVEKAEAAKVEAEKTRRDREDRFGKVASQAIAELQGIWARLVEVVREEAPAAEIQSEGGIRLGRGIVLLSDFQKLDIDQARRVDKYKLISSDDFGLLHIPAYATLTVRCEVDQIAFGDPDRYLWRSTLFYSKFEADEPMRWYETAFWRSHSRTNEPYSLTCDQPAFYGAFSNTMTEHNIAIKPTPIDGLDEQDFIERIMLLLAVASKGRLLGPNEFPIRDTYWQQLERIASR